MAAVVKRNSSQGALVPKKGEFSSSGSSSGAQLNTSCRNEVELRASPADGTVQRHNGERKVWVTSGGRQYLIPADRPVRLYAGET